MYIYMIYIYVSMYACMELHRKALIPPFFHLGITESSLVHNCAYAVEINKK